MTKTKRVMCFVFYGITYKKGQIYKGGAQCQKNLG